MGVVGGGYRGILVVVYVGVVGGGGTEVYW